MQDQIRGIVARILRRYEDSGRYKLAVQYEFGGKIAAATMYTNVTMEEGDCFLADGKWTTDGSDQFYASGVRPSLPHTAPLAELFLEARLNGVQVDRDLLDRLFREDNAEEVFKRLKSEPHLLRNLIPEAHGDLLMNIETLLHSRIQEIMSISILQNAKVEEWAITQIAQEKKLISVVKQPYAHMHVPGVNLQKADKIAEIAGFQTRSFNRVVGKLAHVVKHATTEGSTAIDLPYVNNMMGEDMPESSDLFEIVDRYATNLRASKFEINRDKFISIADRVAREQAIAEAVVNRLLTGRRLDRQMVENEAKHIFALPQFERLDEVQRAAVIMAVVEPICAITGGPGTGKSTVMEAVLMLKERVLRLSSIDPEILPAAPTGKASKRLAETTKRKACTGHRLLKATRAKGTGVDKRSEFRVNRQNPLPEHCVVAMDEVSMLDIDLFEALLDALPASGSLIMTGDDGQLPSVGAGRVLLDLRSARTVTGDPLLPQVELQNVYRQKKTSGIAIGARLMRMGICPDLSESGTGVTFIDKDSKSIADTIVKTVLQKKREGLDIKEIAVLCPQAPGDAGTWDINRRLQEALNRNGAQIMGVRRGNLDDRDMPVPRVGDRVMLTENDPDNDVMNGDLGTIIGQSRTSDGKPSISVQFDSGQLVQWPVSNWRALILAYASTIHKSQGSQYKLVVMPVSPQHHRMLDRALLYTGWTRAEDEVVVVGDRSRFADALTRLKSNDRLTLMRRLLNQAAVNARYVPPVKNWQPDVPVQPLPLPPASQAGASGAPTPTPPGGIGSFSKPTLRPFTATGAFSGRQPSGNVGSGAGLPPRPPVAPVRPGMGLPGLPPRSAAAPSVKSAPNAAEQSPACEPVKTHAGSSMPRQASSVPPGVRPILPTGALRTPSPVRPLTGLKR